MKQLYDDLWQTQVWQPFPNVNTHAYFLRCAGCSGSQCRLTSKPLLAALTGKRA